QEPIGRTVAFINFGRVIEIMSPHLDAVAANRTAETIEAIIRGSGSNPYPWPYLVKAQVKVCQRLPLSDCAAHVNGLVDLVVETRSATKEGDKIRYVLYADMLGALSGQLDANVAARAADALIAILGDGYLIGTMRSEFVDHFGIAEALAKV